MKEKLEVFALVAEIVGATGVIISLIYVAIGVSKNTEAVRVANGQALVAMAIEKNAWFRNADFAAIYVMAQDGIEKLSPVQLRQYLTFVADNMNAWEFAYITHKNGAMDDNIWNGWDGFYKSELATKPFRQFWHEYRQTYSPAFREYLDSQLAKGNGT